MINLTELPEWLRVCKNLKKINFRLNQIRRIKKDELPSSLVHVNFR